MQEKVGACSCRKLFTENLRATEIYVLVTKEGSFDTLSSQNAFFCVRSKTFRFNSVNASANACTNSGAGRRWMGFQKIDVTGSGQQTHRINFRAQGTSGCTDRCGRSKT